MEEGRLVIQIQQERPRERKGYKGTLAQLGGSAEMVRMHSHTSASYSGLRFPAGASQGPVFHYQ